MITGTNLLLWAPESLTHYVQPCVSVIIFSHSLVEGTPVVADYILGSVDEEMGRQRHYSDVTPRQPPSCPHSKVSLYLW